MVNTPIIILIIILLFSAVALILAWIIKTHKGKEIFDKNQDILWIFLTQISGIDRSFYIEYKIVAFIAKIATKAGKLNLAPKKLEFVFKKKV